MAVVKEQPTFMDFSQNRAPIYLQVASVFRRFIESGRWQVGERLPTHEALASQLEVNPATVRKAIGLLGVEGLVAPYRRHGTFVTAKPAEEAWLDLPTSGQGLLTAFDGLAVEWLTEEGADMPDTPAPDRGAWASGYYRMQRLYRRDSLAVVLEEAYLADDIKRSIGLRALKRQPAPQLLKDGLFVQGIDQCIRFGVADQDLARRMELELNAPLAIMDLWAFDRSKTVIYFATAYYRGAVVRVAETIALPARKKRPGP